MKKNQKVKLFLIYSTAFYPTVFYSTAFYSTVFYPTPFYPNTFSLEYCTYKNPSGSFSQK